MTRSLQAVAYPRHSAPESAPGVRRWGLETSRGAPPAGTEDHPRFFADLLTSPRVAAAGPLADVAAARYHQRQPRASLDPVVTGNRDRLRFESHVDVNNPLREALSRIGTDDPLHPRAELTGPGAARLDGDAR